MRSQWGEIIGVRLVDNTAKIKAALREQIANGLNAAGNSWVTDAKANANIDTGFMKEHIGLTRAATPANLSAEVRSLAPYSGPQDTGMRGNMFWTRAYLSTRERFTQFIYGKEGSAGAGVIGAALQEFHGPLGSPERR